MLASLDFFEPESQGHEERASPGNGFFYLLQGGGHVLKLGDLRLGCSKNLLGDLLAGESHELCGESQLLGSATYGPANYLLLSVKFYWNMVLCSHIVFSGSE